MYKTAKITGYSSKSNYYRMSVKLIHNLNHCTYMLYTIYVLDHDVLMINFNILSFV